MVSFRIICCRWLPAVYLSVAIVLLTILPLPFVLLLHPFSWSELPPPSQLPLARFDARMAGDSRTQYLFGGQSEFVFFNDTWALDSKSLSWNLIEPSISPSARARYCVVFASDVLLLFGGASNHGLLNDVWQFDGNLTWTALNTTNSPPPRQSAASTLLDPNQWVIFGGQNGSSSGGDLNDMWSLDLTTKAWCLLPTGPGPRRDAAMLGYHSSIFLYGGRNGETYLDELWQYDYIHWKQIVLYPLPPKQPFVVLPSSSSNSGAFRHETLRLLMSSSIYSLNTEQSYWTFLTSDFPQDLESIYSPAVAVVNEGMDIFVFGGFSGRVMMPTRAEFLATFNLPLLSNILIFIWALVGLMILVLITRAVWTYCFRKRIHVEAAEMSLLVSLNLKETEPFLIRLYKDTVKFYCLMFFVLGLIALPSVYANFAFGVGPLEFRSSSLASNANILWYIIPDVTYTIVYLALVAHWFRKRVSTHLTLSRREELLAFNTILVKGRASLPFIQECGPALSITPIEGGDWIRVVYVRTVSKHRLIERCKWYRRLLGVFGFVSSPPSILVTPACESDISNTNPQFGWWFGTLFLCTAVGSTALYISAIYFSVEETLVRNGWVLGAITAVSSAILRHFVKVVCSSMPSSRQSRESVAEAFCLMLELSQMGGAYLGARVWLGPLAAVTMIYGLLLTSIGVRVIIPVVTVLLAYSRRHDKVKMADTLKNSPIASWSALRLLLKTTMLFSSQVPLLLFLCSLCLCVVHLCDMAVSKFCKHWNIVIIYPSYNPALWTLIVRQHEIIIVIHLLSSIPNYVQFQGVSNPLIWWLFGILSSLVVQGIGHKIRLRRLADIDLSTCDLLVSP